MKNGYLFILALFLACDRDSSLSHAPVIKSGLVTEFKSDQFNSSLQPSDLQYFLNPQVEANFSSLTSLQIPCYQDNQLVLKTHIIRPGQTLNTISHAYSVHIQDIIANNPALIYGVRSNMVNGIKIASSQKALVGDKNKKMSSLLKKEGSPKVIETKSQQKTFFDLKPGKPWLDINTVFSKIQQKETVYSELDGIHRIIAITLPDKTEPSFEFYATTQKTGVEELFIRKVVIKDPDILIDQSLKVGVSVKDIIEHYPNPIITTARSSVVILPETTEKVALVLESFSIDWKPDGDYKLKDIPDHVKVRSIQLF